MVSNNFTANLPLETEKFRKTVRIV